MITRIIATILLWSIPVMATIMGAGAVTFMMFGGMFDVLGLSIEEITGTGFALLGKALIGVYLASFILTLVGSIFGVGALYEWAHKQTMKIWKETER